MKSINKIIKGFRWVLFKFSYRKREIINPGHNLLNVELSLSESIENLEIKKTVIFRDNCHINVRENASLYIGENAFFNYGCVITCRDRINIGDNVSVGPYCCFFDNDHDYRKCNHSEEFITSPITIGNNVWLGAGCIILRGGVIGDDCVIGAGTIVKGKVPENTILYNRRDCIMREANVVDDQT